MKSLLDKQLTEKDLPYLQEIKDTKYFKYDDFVKLETSLLMITSLHEFIDKRRDLLTIIEHFIQNSLEFISKNCNNGLIKSRYIVFISVYMNSIYNLNKN